MNVFAGGKRSPPKPALGHAFLASRRRWRQRRIGGSADAGIEGGVERIMAFGGVETISALPSLRRERT